MAEQDKIQARIAVAFPGGVTIDESTVIQETLPPTAFAYDKIDVVVPKAAAPGGAPGTIAVDIQPANKDNLQFLLIQADNYGEKLTYKVGDDDKAIQLDWLQMFCGAGMLSLLPTDAPKTLKFSNGLDKDVKVTILVGRKAKSS